MAVSLRTYILDLFKAERIRVDEREKHNRRQLRLQHEEYKRRLDDLNHEAERIALIQESYVPRETFDGYVEKQEEDAQRVREALSLASGEKLGSGEIITRLFASLGFLMAIIGLIIGGKL